jgi:tetratricopeptide (TPR) repeat protein
MAARFRPITKLALLVLGLTPPATLRAQASAFPDALHTPRPRLHADADTNDWEAYFDLGAELLRQRRGHDALAAFYWATRLNPGRAEPLFGEYAAFWAQDPQRLQRVLEEDSQTVASPDVRRADSLRQQALLRNPLVFQGQLAIAFDRLPGIWRDDEATSGWLEYANLHFPQAVRFWRGAIRHDPRRNYWLHYDLALAFLGLGQLDSAGAELSTLTQEMRQREERHLVQVWASKALFLYAIARVDAARGDAPSARTALEQALVEDLSFYQAHASLGQLALQSGDAPGALREYEEATTLRPDDPVLRYDYARALLAAQRLPDAEVQLARAIELEPLLADSYLALGASRLQRGDRAGALQALRDYVARAPRSAPTLEAARRQIDALNATLNQENHE